MQTIFAVLCYSSAPGLDRSNFNIGDTHLPRQGKLKAAWKLSLSPCLDLDCGFCQSTPVSLLGHIILSDNFILSPVKIKV